MEAIATRTKDDPEPKLPAFLDEVRTAAEQMLDAARGSHAWDHTLRVYRLCERIGRAEKADLAVLLTAAYLHDVGRSDQDRSRGDLCHAEKGAEMAADLVAGLPLSRNQQENILHCIRSHRFRGRCAPRTLEARVLFDADKLDAIGAVGVARAYLFAGEVGARLHNPEHRIENTHPYSREDTGYREYRIKLARIRERIQTRAGGKIAADRHRFMERFFERLIGEVDGRL